MKKLKINCFGEGYILQKLVFSDEELLHIKEALSNGFELYDILHHPDVALLERETELKHKGLLNTYKNQIEIWFGGKKIQKFKLNDLDTDFIAFPFFHATQSEYDLSLLSPGIYATEKEIGLVHSFEVLTENFEVEKLIFHITKVYNSFPFVACNGVSYDGQLLFSQKSDTVLTEQTHFVVG